MRPLYTLIALVCFFYNWAQDTQTPNFAQIEQEITNRNSEYYYPKLEVRYKNADTSLTQNELRHLYYGYAYVKQNKKNNTMQKLILRLNQLANITNPTPADYKNTLACSDTLLLYQPYNLTLKQIRCYCFEQLGKSEEAIKEKNQYEMIVDAILSSGTGQSKNSSIYLLSLENETDIINLLGFKPASQPISLKTGQDYILLEENVYRTRGLYFSLHIRNHEVTGLE